MAVIVDGHPVSVCSLGQDGQPPSPSAGNRGLVMMFVTNEGLNDPRVCRSIRAASHAGLAVRLVCRALPPEKKTEPETVPPGTEVYRVPQLRLRRLLGRIFLRRRGPAGSDSSAPGSPSATLACRAPRGERFWLRPWEIWILGGMTWFNWQAVRRMRHLPADLYHANDLDTLPAAVLLSRRNRVPLIYDAHELFAAQFTGASRQFRSILFSLEHWLIRYADSVVTVSRSIAETLAAWHGVPVPRVVMNCPSARPLMRAGAAGAIPRQSPLTRVVYQGIYLRERGLEELILSVPQFDSAELYLRGYGDLEPTLRALVEGEGLQGRVHFLPPADPRYMVESLAGFDIGVVPYRPTNLCHQYCLPNKVFEYLQAGLALAVSALPELEQLVKETGTGELFNSDCPDDIARAINALTKDPGRLEETKSKARSAAIRYTWEAQGEPQILACYRELIGMRVPYLEGVR